MKGVFAFHQCQHKENSFLFQKVSPLVIFKEKKRLLSPPCLSGKQSASEERLHVSCQGELAVL